MALSRDAASSGQQTFDRRRNMVDANVELLRWSKFTPFAGVSWNRYDGPGTSTYHVGEDEFLLLTLHDTDRENAHRHRLRPRPSRAADLSSNGNEDVTGSPPLLYRASTTA